MLALIETTADPEGREEFMATLGSALARPGGQERALAAYALLDQLVDAGPTDPRVDEAARALADCLPRDLLPEPLEVDPDNSFLRAFYADFAPAQAEAIRRTLRILTEGDGP